jgi:TonB family protein
MMKTGPLQATRVLVRRRSACLVRSMRVFVWLIATLAFSSVALAQVPSPSASRPQINMPRPRYPNKWAAQGITGKGIVQVTVDSSTGRITSARMLKSTGHKVLDDSALEAFSKWLFKPGTVSPVKIPIEFTSRLRHDQQEKDPRLRKAFAEADAYAERRTNDPLRLGDAYEYWRFKKEFLLRKYGILWKDPSEMNPEFGFN